jgi:nickel transport protein
MRQTFYPLWAIFIFWSFLTSSALAHKVILFAWVESGRIHSESSFGGKRKVKKGKINVSDKTGRIILTGETDQNGNYSFDIPKNILSDITLTLDAGTGHKAQWKLTRDEILIRKTGQELQKTIEMKKSLEKGPSLFKILSGIAILFLLASVLKIMKKGRQNLDD